MCVLTALHENNDINCWRQAYDRPSGEIRKNK